VAVTGEFNGTVDGGFDVVVVGSSDGEVLSVVDLAGNAALRVEGWGR